MSKKRANGEGSIRRRADGNWEGRYVANGKRHSVYGRSQKAVREKLTEIQTALDQGRFIEPSKITLEEWFRQWLEVYCTAKPSSKVKYETDMRVHVLPSLGHLPLQKLTPMAIQQLYHKKECEGLAPKTIKGIHCVIHKTLDQAVKLRLIQRNISDDCETPRVVPKEMRPLKDAEVGAFLQANKGSVYEQLNYVAVFTGMRQGELIGLTWDCIDFERGTIRLYRQIQKEKQKGGQYKFVPLKNSEARTIMPAQQVMKVLQQVKGQQEEWRNRCGDAWYNQDSLVFTNPMGVHLCPFTVFKHFKKIVKRLGLAEVRFHDLRHTFAVLSLQNGADIKSVSVMMGHSTVAFTMDKYGHVSDAMQIANANRMQNYIDSL